MMFKKEKSELLSNLNHKSVIVKEAIKQESPDEGILYTQYLQ